MMMKVILLAILFYPLTIFSQENFCPCNFRMITSAGMVAGESSAKPLFQLSSGITYHRFYTGIGAGIDPYRFHSIPLFADWRMDLGKKRSVFVYGNAGYNFPYDNKEAVTDPSKISDRFTGGFYMDAGLGYRLPLNKMNRMLLSAGYSHKRINNVIGYRYFWCRACEEEIYTYQYDLGRIVAKLSWEFGK